MWLAFPICLDFAERNTDLFANRLGSQVQHPLKLHFCGKGAAFRQIWVYRILRSIVFKLSLRVFFLYRQIEPLYTIRVASAGTCPSPQVLKIQVVHHPSTRNRSEGIVVVLNRLGMLESI